MKPPAFETRLDRRHLLSLAAAGAAGVALTGASRSSVTAQDTTTLEFLTVATDARVEAIQDALIAEFQQANPTITVNKTAVPFDQYTARMSQLIAMGSDIDVLWVDPTQIPELVVRDLLLPLDEYYGPEDAEALLDIAYQVTQYEGARYSAPIWESSGAVYYNADLFAQAGVQPPTESSKRWTWQELLEVARQVAQPPDVFGLVMGQWNRPYQIWPLPESNGTGTVDDVVDLENLKTEGRLNSPTSVEALRFYGDLYNEYEVAPKSPIPEAFFTGKTAMYITIPPQRLLIEELAPDLNWGVTYHPSFKVPVTPCNSWHLAATKKARNPEAAAQFIQFLTSPEADERWFEAGLLLPVYKATYENHPESFSDNSVGHGELKIAREELMNSAVPRPRVPGYGAYEDLFRVAIEDIVNGADAEEELNNAVEEIDAQLARYRG